MCVRPLALALACLLAACDATNSSLPPPPVDRAPVLRGFAPASGFTDDVVTLDLDPAGDPSSLTIRFGVSAAVPVAFSGSASSKAIFSARVPADATTGPLVLANRGGAAAPSELFTFRGAGHLRSGRIATTRLLTPTIRQAASSRVRLFTAMLTTAPVRAIQLDERGDIFTVIDFDGGEPVAMAMTPDGAHLGVVTQGATAACPALGAAALAVSLYVITAADEPGTLGTLEARICLENSPNPDAVPALATTPAASHFLVTLTDGTTSTVHLVDVAAKSVTTHHVARWLRAPVAHDDGFLVLDDTGLRKIVPGATAEAWPAASLPLLEDGFDAPRALSARPGEIVIGTATGRVLLGHGAFPPTFDEEVDGLATLSEPGWDGTTIDGISISADGSALALTQMLWGRALTLRRDDHGGWIPLAERLLPLPSEVRDSGNGTFTVVTAQGIVVLSAATGAQVIAYTSGALLRSARMGRCDDGTPALLVGSLSFGLVERLDPASGAELCPPLSPWIQADLRELAASPEAAHTFTFHEDGTLTRTNAAGRTEVRADAGVPGQSFERQLSLSADGTLLALIDCTTDTARLYDAAAPAWATAPVQSLALPHALRELFHVGPAMVLVGRNELRIHATPAAAAKVVAAPEALINAVAIGPDVLVFGEPDLHARALAWVLDPVAGTLSEAGSVDLVAAIMFATASPDQRRVTLIALDQASSRSVVRLVWDPIARRIVGTEAPIFLHSAEAPHTARELVASPDGGRLFVLDTYGDSVWTLE